MNPPIEPNDALSMASTRTGGSASDKPGEGAIYKTTKKVFKP
jgi:hypothetical protein